ncbi:hypothetical protein Pmani_001797 [Petrolisthes manimaculis]|uniref:SAP domain-containing protein n=1 Tax=Petrolisthes manimaculis TaxID=1843537 RepID=A0AAE1UR74_9EUCA|nr:hypothetical protein Pmani_024033 [Petrolisthes manimaculis]KAK4327046.1 hypothetical protein Pmani_002492 [Petrolisthes manimaculis]KAK4327755.1 hypothetical protein Pmani_001797 [Petrolisthes manimaculis]
MDKLTVVDLKAELEKRGLDTRGTRATLMDRLRIVMESEGVDPNVYFSGNDEQAIRPEDSVSQTSRHGSSTTYGAATVNVTPFDVGRTTFNFTTQCDFGKRVVHQQTSKKI